VLVNDNAESRKLIEQCYQKGRVTVNPIVEWSDADVWDFIRDQHLPVCSLYGEGFTRIGCIGCPMARPKKRLEEFARFPQYARLYRRAIEKYLARIKEKGTPLPECWGDGSVNDVWHWWLQDRPVGQEVLPGFEDDYEDN